jgi:4-hydroxybenzoate polyprenyltransferase
MTPGRGITAFLIERCLPVYPVFLTLWVFAVESITVVLGGSAGPWRPSWDTPMKVLALVAAGAFLRMVDDQKDLDYDRYHHPTRPLVQGRVTTRQLRTAMVPAAAMALVLAGAVSLWALILLAAALSYSVALWWTETKVGVVRDNALVNLGAVCPIQFLVTGFSMTGEPGVGNAAWWRLALVPVVFTSAFLHVEIARKTTRVPDVGDTADRHSYSELIGANASAVMACGFGLFAVLAELLVTSPWSSASPGWSVAWLPLATAALPLASAWRFTRSGMREHPQVLPTVFVIVFYLSIIAQGLLS